LYLYALGEDRAVYIIRVVEGLSPVLEERVKTGDANVVGVDVSGEGNLMAVWDDEGSLKLFRPAE
jgi:hypothetical protein